jgi:hypothetical protein
MYSSRCGVALAQTTSLLTCTPHGVEPGLLLQPVPVHLQITLACLGHRIVIKQTGHRQRLHIIERHDVQRRTGCLGQSHRAIEGRGANHFGRRDQQHSLESEHTNLILAVRYWPEGQPDIPVDRVVTTCPASIRRCLARVLIFIKQWRSCVPRSALSSVRQLAQAVVK